MILDHVLIPLDGLEATDELLTWVRSLIHFEGKVSFLRVIKVPTYSGFRPVLVTKEERNERSNLQRKHQEAIEYLEHVSEIFKVSGSERVEMHVKIGDPAKIIVDLAKELQAEAIVMSTHHRDGFYRWILESTTIKVLHEAYCPVLIFPKCKKMLMGYQTTSSKKCIPSPKRLACPTHWRQLDLRV